MSEMKQQQAQEDLGRSEAVSEAQSQAQSEPREPVIIGIGGPVGSGKTQLVERLTRAMQHDYSMAAITNDIYTIEDAKILARTSVLPEERIVGIETGAAPTPRSARTPR